MPISPLNKHLLQGPDLLNKLMAILLRFWNDILCDGRHLINLLSGLCHSRKLRHVTFYLVREWKERISNNEYVMNVHIFGKVDSLCVCNWLLKRIALDNIGVFNEKVLKAVIDKFYMQDYLD